MKDSKNLLIVLVLTVVNLPVLSYAGTWMGANLVQNGSFESGFNYWENSDRWELFQYTGSSEHCAWSRGWTTKQKRLTQSVVVEAGKRYQLYGCSYSPWRNYISVTGGLDLYVSWYKTPHGMIGNSKSIIGVASAGGESLIKLQAQGQTWDGSFDYIKLRQVVYDPQIDIVEDAITAQAGSDGLTANVGITLNDLSFADTPTNWWIDWGDGNIDLKPKLNSFAEHTYDLTSGITDYTASLYGENQAGNITDTVDITIVPEPASLSFISFGALGLIRKRKAS